MQLKKFIIDVSWGLRYTFGLVIDVFMPFSLQKYIFDKLAYIIPDKMDLSLNCLLIRGEVRVVNFIMLHRLREL